MTLCIVSQRVFIVVSVYIIIDSVRKPLDIPSYREIDELYVRKGNVSVGNLHSATILAIV
jgi:hypothetical protein